ncbi:hypothetical protein CBS101457_005956 [Exobasidium rhododendri]|nr:hypothetical protein CBS101457_005956 [Exobasidium rhododendri]
MARKGMSLSAQMAELSNVAPGDVDMDPESDADAYDAVQRIDGDDSDEDLEEKARSHARHNYIDVAPSKMRKQANFMEGLNGNRLEKFAGIKATRKEMMDDGDDEEIADEGETEEDDVEEDEEIGEEGDDIGDDEDDSSDVNEEDEEDEEESGGKEKRTLRKRSQVRFEATSEEDAPKRNELTAAQSDAQLLQELRKRSRDDAEKGRDARRQMDAWNKLLGIRIREQKVVRGAGRIPSGMIQKSLTQFSEKDREAYESTLSSLDDMSSQLFALQRSVLQSFTGTNSMEGSVISSGLARLERQIDLVSKPSKRSHDEVDEDRSHLDTLLEFDQTVFEPLWRDVLARWSSRTSVSNVSEGHKTKFESSLKAMNQSAEDQIDRGLTGDAFDRLRKRTRVWRGSEKESRIVAEEASNDGEDSDEEARKEMAEADIFDDSDFYAAMLRELIDSRGAASIMGANGAAAADSSLAWAQAAKRASKKNKMGDMKASKGRKLRFDVIEKLENFMPPIPRETWSKDQIDRLLNQLRGGHRGVEDVGVSDKAEASNDDTVELAGLRLFG